MPKNSLFQNTNPNRLHPGPIFPHSVLTSFALLKAGSQRHRATRSHMSCRSSTAFSHTAPSAWPKVCKWTQFSCWKSVSGVKLNPTKKKNLSTSAHPNLSRDSLPSADHVILLSKKFVDWLRYASITQGGGATSGGFFAGPRSRQVSRAPPRSPRPPWLVTLLVRLPSQSEHS